MRAEKTLSRIAWGMFFILLGLVWMAREVTGQDLGSFLAVGIGLILIGLNATRSAMGIEMSRFSLAIGIMALLIGLAGIIGYRLPLIPTILIMIGLFIMSEAALKAGRERS